MIIRTHAFLCLCIFFSLTASFASEVETTVKYIAESAIYLDAGRANNVRVGDNVRVKRDEKLIAVLEVIFVSDKSSSCKLLESILPIVVGDKAVIFTQEIKPNFVDDTLNASKIKESKIIKSSEKKGKFRGNILSGRIGLQFYTQKDLELPSNDYSQPSLLINSKLSRIGGSFYSFSLRLRIRKNNRDRELSSSTESQWNNRLYEAAFQYNNTDEKLSYGFGRMQSNSLLGIGYIDGLNANYKLTENFSIGAFGGAEPDARNTDFQSDELKSGLYANYTQGNYSENRISSTIAIAGSYHKSEISREFIYQQVDYLYGNKLYFFESMELNINRDWLKANEGSTLKLSNFLLSARYAIASKASVSLNYDNRRNFYTYESKDIPDSLFDDDIRQGLRVGLSLRLPLSYYADLSAGFRGKSTDLSSAKTISANIGSYNFLQKHVAVSAKFSAYSNSSTSGYQPSLSISKDVVSFLNTGFQLGKDMYDLKSTNQSIASDWIRLNVDAMILKHWYGSGSFEFQRGDGLDADRFFLEAGYRF